MQPSAGELECHQRKEDTEQSNKLHNSFLDVHRIISRRSVSDPCGRPEDAPQSKERNPQIQTRNCHLSNYLTSLHNH